MTLFFQHVGEAGAKRDFPRTIGTARDGADNFYPPEFQSNFGTNLNS